MITKEEIISNSPGLTVRKNTDLIQARVSYILEAMEEYRKVNQDVNQDVNQQELITSGWVIETNGMINLKYFKPTQADCINSFIKGTGKDWNYFMKKFKYRCIKVDITKAK